MNETIINFIEKFCYDNRIELKDLQGKDRHFEVTLQRHLLMYLLKTKFGISLETIGRYFNRDHTSVVHAIYKISDMIYTHDSALEPYKKYLQGKTIYISGQVSNINYTDAEYSFLKAESYLSKQGHKVINPLRLVPRTASHTTAMKICLRELLFCDAIYMLKGWQNSVGANLEHTIAKACGLEVIYQEEV